MFDAGGNAVCAAADCIELLSMPKRYSVALDDVEIRGHGARGCELRNAGDGLSVDLRLVSADLIDSAENALHLGMGKCLRQTLLLRKPDLFLISAQSTPSVCR